MKVYNEQWIYNRNVLEQAERWHRQQLLSDEQMTAVRKAYPVGFRQTNSFLEIGLFLFTTVAILACYLLLASMFTLFSESTTYGIFNVLSGITVGLVGRVIIDRRLLYRNGIDNAFVVTMAGFLAFGYNQFLPDGLSLSAHCFLTLPLLLLILWYYGDTLIGFLALATFYTAVFDGLIKYDWGKDALPFVMMGISLILYVVVNQVVLRNSKQVYYTDPLTMTQWIALIVLVASSNYFVVRELNGLLLKTSFVGSRYVDAPEIGLPWLFWLLTFGIPTVYVWQGLTKKNRMLIILGVLGVIAAVATVHEYTALVPLNVVLTIGGLIMIGLAVLSIRYLRQGKHGFTDSPDDDSPNEFFMNVATAVVVQATSSIHHGPKDDLRFGDGDFGGAGSEGKY